MCERRTRSTGRKGAGSISALIWLSFGYAIALVGLTIVGLAANELSNKRLVNRLSAVEPGEPALKSAEYFSAAA